MMAKGTDPLLLRNIHFRFNRYLGMTQFENIGGGNLRDLKIPLILNEYT